MSHSQNVSMNSPIVVKPLIISVARIHNDRPSKAYDLKDLRDAADSILESGGVVTPLVVKRRGFDEYDLIHGEFVYLAALIALQLNPIRGETIDAYVIDAQNEQAMRKQLRLFLGVEFPSSPNNIRATRAVSAEQRAQLPARWF